MKCSPQKMLSLNLLLIGINLEADKVLFFVRMNPASAAVDVRLTSVCGAWNWTCLSARNRSGCLLYKSVYPLFPVWLGVWACCSGSGSSSAPWNSLWKWYRGSWAALHCIGRVHKVPFSSSLWNGLYGNGNEEQLHSQSWIFPPYVHPLLLPAPPSHFQ